MSQPVVSLLDVSTYLPGEPISADYYAQFADSDDLRDNLMFRAPKFRHHVAPDETAIDMVERAAAGLVDRHGSDALADVDILITHTQLPDMPFYGGGGGMANRLGMKPNWVIDLHNGGCAAFILGLKLAKQLIASGEGRTALVAVAQNALNFWLIAVLGTGLARLTGVPWVRGAFLVVAYWMASEFLLLVLGIGFTR